MEAFSSSATTITTSTSASGKAVRVRLKTISEADEAYLQIVRWIFTSNLTTKPSTLNC